MPETPKTSPPKSRSARKRQAILDAATELFLRDGYKGTSMDQVAARAAVSKQTVYKNFTSKEALLAAILQRITERANEFIETVIPELRRTTDLEADLRKFAQRYLHTVLQPQVLQLRRLIISEANHLPDLARDYYQRVPERTLEALASVFRDLGDRGQLKIEDARVAAGHFAFLILGEPLDRAMFVGWDSEGPEGEREGNGEGRVEVGVGVFWAAYGGG